MFTRVHDLHHKKVYLYMIVHHGEVYLDMIVHHRKRSSNTGILT